MQSHPQASRHQQLGSTQQSKPLSCISCRQRKVKCDRISPCSPCVRSSLSCAFPARKRTQRQHQGGRNGELMQRLSRLESIVAKVDPGALEDARQQAEQGGQQQLQDVQQAGVRISLPQQTAGNTNKHLGILNDRYISAEFWVILSNEVDGIRAALEQDTGSSTEEENTGSSPAAAQYTSPESSGGSTSLHDPAKTVTSEALLGNTRGAVGHYPLLHPPPDIIRQLFERYFDGVDLVLKILHKPTCVIWIESFINGGSLDPSHEALLFGIYFGAISSWTPEDCFSNLGEEKCALASRYRSDLETALARADYLNTESMECLQALTIYIACLRSHSASRPSWALCGLAMRLAQGINLHRDGAGTQFTPFEAEMRRRLWWQLIVLDIRAAEDRGTEVIVTRGSHDTQMPTNISDDEFGPETTTPLLSRKGPTDITFSLATAKCSDIFSFIGHPQSQTAHFRIGGYIPVSSNTLAMGDVRDTEQSIITYSQHLEEEFVNSAVETHKASHLAATTVRICILKMWLSMQYPFHLSLSSSQSTASIPPQAAPKTQILPIGQGGVQDHPPAGSVPQKPTPIPHDFILRTTTAILELSSTVQQGHWASSYGWWCATWAQWHPLAVCLATLCTVSTGELADRAWKAIDAGLPRIREQVADSHRGKLWRPMRKLLRRARTARATEGVAVRSPGLDVGHDDMCGSGGGRDVGHERTEEEVIQEDGSGWLGGQDGGDEGNHDTNMQITDNTPVHDTGAWDAQNQPPDDMLGFNMVDMSLSPSSFLEHPAELLRNLTEMAPMDYSNDWDIWNDFVKDTRAATEEK